MARRGDPRDKRAGQMDSVLLRVPPDLDEAIYELAVVSKLPAGFVVALAIGLLLRLLRREAAAIGAKTIQAGAHHAAGRQPAQQAADND